MISVEKKELFAELLIADNLLGRCRYTGLARALPHLDLIDIEPGQELFKVGAPANYLYIITEGVAWLRLSSGQYLPMSHQRCGEEAITQGAIYSATAEMPHGGKVLRLSRAALNILLHEDGWLRTELLLSLTATLTGVTPRSVPPPISPEQPKSAPTVAPMPWYRKLGWLLCMALPAAVLINEPALTSHMGWQPSVTIFLGIFLTTVIMWSFSLVDDYIPGLFALLAILLTGLVPAPVMVSGFGSNGFLMAMSTLALGTVVASSGLSYRIMLLMLAHLPKGQFWQNLGLFTIGALLTPVIPTANGRIALVAPFLKDMAESLRLAARGSAATRLTSSAFAGISLLSASVLSAKSVNFAVFGFLPPQDQQHFQWLTWFTSAIVVSALLCATFAVLAGFWFRNAETADLPRKLIRAQLDLLGPMKAREIVTLSALGSVLLGILTSQWHKVQPPWLVLGVLLALLLLGTLRRREFKEQVDWTFLLYLSGVTGLVSAISYLGIDQLIGTSLPGLGQLLQNHFEWFVLGLFVGIQLLRLAIPTNATVVILAAVMMPVAELNGVNPWVLGCIILLFSEAWFLPYQCSYYLQLREVDKTGRLYDEASFLRFNATLNFMRLAAVYASIPFWHQLGYL